jgi:hypothetical protein
MDGMFSWDIDPEPFFLGLLQNCFNGSITLRPSRESRNQILILLA